MRLFRSTKENRITQGFGQNHVPFYKEMGMLGHNGIDFGCRMGARLYWDLDQAGTVLETHIDSSGGLGIVILSRDTDGQYYKHRFWHLKSFRCIPGQKLSTGDIIGFADNTGRSTGSHLHRDLKKCTKEGKTIGWTKDYRGAINPEPYLENIFVVDKMRELLGELITLTQKVAILLKKLINYI